MNDELFNLMKLLQKEQILMCFSGPFSQKILVTLTESIKVSLSEEDNSSTLIHKVFSTVVELTQNIIEIDSKFMPKESDNLLFSSGLILVGKMHDGAYVASVNALDINMTEKMKAYLGNLKDMDKQELKKLYFKKLREGSEEKIKGGGVGLITIARNAEALMFDLLPGNNKYSYLVIKATFR